MNPLDVFSPELRAAIEQLVDERVDERLAAVEARRDADASPWLYEAQAAADYLGCSRERIYKRLHEIPHHRTGSRLMFLRDELDRYALGAGDA